MSTPEDYKNLISEIVKKQMDILGPEIALSRANGVSGLKVGGSGEVVDLSQDPQQVLQLLIDRYIALSGEIVKNILSPVFAKYPTIKLDLK